MRKPVFVVYEKHGRRLAYAAVQPSQRHCIHFIDSLTASPGAFNYSSLYIISVAEIAGFSAVCFVNPKDRFLATGPVDFLFVVGALYMPTNRSKALAEKGNQVLHI